MTGASLGCTVGADGAVETGAGYGGGEYMNFEEYALYKRFSRKVPASWDKAFRAQLSGGSPGAMPEKRVLDFGAGDGRLFNYFLSLGFLRNNIFGVEVSEKRIELCKTLGWSNMFLLSGENRLPFRDRMFDIVTCMEVIEHIKRENISFYLSEWHRVLKDDGVIILTTPQYPIKRFYDVVDAFFTRDGDRLKDDPTHFAKYNHGTLKALLQRYFRRVSFTVFKQGFLFSLLSQFKLYVRFFIHKMLVVVKK